MSSGATKAAEDTFLFAVIIIVVRSLHDSKVYCETTRACATL